MEAAAATEAERVEGWRLHVLVEAGYPAGLAEQIAASNADLHQAVDLIHAGCPAHTAAHILI